MGRGPTATGIYGNTKPAPHETLLDLLACGLDWDAACRLSFEEAQCLLHVHFHREALAALDSESARIASLAFADSEDQRRALTALSLRAKALEHRFRRDYQPVNGAPEGEHDD